MAENTSNESWDSYSKVIVRFETPGEKGPNLWRVIACRGDLQWILQKGAVRRGEREWRSLCYCHTQKTLIRRTTEHVPDVGPDALEVLEALPRDISLINQHTTGEEHVAV